MLFIHVRPIIALNEDNSLPLPLIVVFLINGSTMNVVDYGSRSH